MRIHTLTALMSGAVLSLFVVPALAGPALDRVIAEKNIRLGIRTDAPPFASLVDGKPAGFSVDLCALIAGAIMDTSDIDEMTGTFVSVDTEDRFKSVAEGEIDVLCGATTATLTRREMVSFSIPVFSTGIGAAVSKDAPALLKEVLVEGGPAVLSDAAITEALEGKTLLVRAGTTAEEWVRGSPLEKIKGVTVATTDDHKAGLESVAVGTADVYFADLPILIGQRADLGDSDAVLLSRNTFTHEPYALALQRGDEDLRLAIDRALSHIYRTGAVYKVFNRHFGKSGAEERLFYSLVTLPE